MQLVNHNRVFLLLAWLGCLATSLPVFAQQDTLQVLILNSYDESAAPYFRPTEEFREQQRRAEQHSDAGLDCALCREQHSTDSVGPGDCIDDALTLM
jgi:hypothetical protein